MDGGLVGYAAIDHNFCEHPKHDVLSDAAFRLHISGIVFCSRHRLDGLLPADRVRRLVPRFRAAALQELLDRSLWFEVFDGAAYEIRDYLQWNPSRAQIEERIAAKSKAGKKGAEAKWHKP